MFSFPVSLYSRGTTTSTPTNPGGGGTGESATNDPYWESVVFYAPFDTGVTDVKSGIANSATISVGSAAGGKFGNGLKFTADNGIQRYAQSALFDFATRPFTIDGWVQFPVVPPSNTYILDIGANGFFFQYVGGKWQLGASATAIVSVTATPPVNTPIHFEISRKGDVLNLFINGVLTLTKTGIAATSYGGNATFTLGNYGQAGSYSQNGMIIDDVRVTRGVARHTANFTPPTFADATTGPTNGAWDSVAKAAALTYTANLNQRGITKSASSGALSSAKGDGNTIKSSGKWYYEVTIVSGGGDIMIGYANESSSVDNFAGQNTNSAGYRSNGTITNPNTGGTPATYTVGDTIGVAIDIDTKTVQYYKKSGTSMVATGNSHTYTPNGGQGVTGTRILPFISLIGAPSSILANFGNEPFVQVPTGYNAGFYSFDTWGTAGTNWAVTNANLTATHSTTAVSAIRSSSFKTSGTGNGKYYLEVTVGAQGTNANELAIGICMPTTALTGTYPGGDGTCHAWYNSGPIIFGNAGIGSGGTFTIGDRIGVALDITPATKAANSNSGRIQWYKNGTLVTTTNAHAGTQYHLIMGSDRAGSGTVNFTPATIPSGYVAWSVA